MQNATVVPLVSADSFPIFELPDNAPESREKIGKTFKFWFGGQQLLYKEARAETGEHWAEKMGSELAVLMGLPSARVELASYHGRIGMASFSVLMDAETLTTFNDWIVKRSAHLADEVRAKATRHTLANVFGALHDLGLPLRWTPRGKISKATQAFTGYLLFDAWISNSDRHQENWGIVNTPPTLQNGVEISTHHLSPTFDHASSLGRELTDEKREAILKGGDLTEYLAACKSGLVSDESDEFLDTHTVAAAAARAHPEAARIWIDRILELQRHDINALFDRLPPEIITPVSRRFATWLLETSAARLATLRESLERDKNIAHN